MNYGEQQLSSIIDSLLDEQGIQDLPEATAFNTLLRKAWQANQAQRQLDQQAILAVRLERISAWLQDEASADQIRQARRDIEEDERAREFYETGRQLKERLALVHWLPPTAAPAKRKTVTAHAGLSPLYTLRDGGRKSQSIGVKVPDEYGFSARLTVTDNGNEHYRVRGRVSANRTMLADLEGATIWLLPPDPEARNWPETTLTRTGSFRFEKPLAGGTYRFEMNWADEFLEVLDVIIPNVEE